MRYIMIIAVALSCLGVHGCGPDRPITPPDHVLDPRNQ
jgi:hypothetical protein